MKNSHFGSMVFFWQFSQNISQGKQTQNPESSPTATQKEVNFAGYRQLIEIQAKRESVYHFSIRFLKRYLPETYVQICSKLWQNVWSWFGFTLSLGLQKWNFSSIVHFQHAYIKYSFMLIMFLPVWTIWAFVGFLCFPVSIPLTYGVWVNREDLAIWDMIKKTQE